MKDRDIELLKKFLDHRCSQEERQHVQQLLQRAENIRVLDELMAEQSAIDWERGGDTDPEQQFIIERWKLLLRYRIAQEAKSRSKLLWMGRLHRVTAAAVAILFVAAIYLVGYKRMAPTISYVEHHNTSGTPVKYSLPDSTLVYLAAGSRLRYPQQFLRDTREILLNGEAFFDVTPDSTKPFIIYTGNVQTRVLGTSFRITAFESKSIEVAVASGKVEVKHHRSGASKTLALLTKGQKVSYEPTSGLIQKGQVNVTLLEQWVKGEVFFEGERLGTITESLQRLYGVAIRFEQPELATYRLSATFMATESLESVMDMLSFVGKFGYRFDRQRQVINIYARPR